MNSENPEKSKLNPPPQRPVEQSNTKSEPKFKNNIDVKTKQNKDTSNKEKREKNIFKLPPPSPWLTKTEPELLDTASFVEYLRWMRSPNFQENEIYKKRDNDAKLQLLSIAEDRADYSQRLQTLTQRTRNIVKCQGGIICKVTCPWRIRVGGHRGPESILLPAFDALGMPYIPSSTLRGVARNQAIRYFMEKNDYKWEKAEEKVALWFGSLDAKNKKNCMGKVIFLDAYPIVNADREDLSGGLAIDIANNIWSWNEDCLNYSPNPNIYFSLQKPTFLVGIIPRIKGEEGKKNCDRVKKWLVKGLANGTGSQINSGYGRLITHTKDFSKEKIYQLLLSQELFRVNFTLEGQLIHSYKKLNNPNQPYKKYSQTGEFERDKNQQLKFNDRLIAEIRPTAFKSMLRYWFRALTLGVWEIHKVKTWEAKLFGSINTQYNSQGWLKLNAFEVADLEQLENTQEGVLIFALSSEASRDKQEEIKKLFMNLLWIMSFLGGVGLGARRPYHEKKDNPKIRGSSIEIFSSNEVNQDENSWNLPSSIERCEIVFNDKLKGFYQALGKLVDNDENAIIFYPSKSVKRDKLNEHYWVEALDQNCEIWVTFANKNDKSHALQVLHNYYHSLEKNEYSMAKSLCGGIKKDYPQGMSERDVIPSPIWIANYDIGSGKSYQVITVFGAKFNPRKEYLQKLKEETNHDNHKPIFSIDTNDDK